MQGTPACSRASATRLVVSEVENQHHVDLVAVDQVAGEHTGPFRLDWLSRTRISTGWERADLQADHECALAPR